MATFKDILEIAYKDVGGRCKIMNDKEKAYNTVALKYYELEELKKIRYNLSTMIEGYKAKVKIKTLHEDFINGQFRFKTKRKSFEIAPKLLMQIIDKLIENKQEYLDKAIDLTLFLEQDGKEITNDNKK